MNFRIVVLAKQVPDTRNVGKDAMKEDGTVNRAALPAIFNPEDLNALELALRMKDQIPDSEVIILTMGPFRAAEIVRESMYRGADKGYLITDRKFAGSDTLATSYTLSLAVKKLMPCDVVIAGRQAIDGDTAQVGPQTAEKLNMPQITYAEELVNINKESVTIKRRLERGIEVVQAKFPVMITVHSSAPDCRPRNAKLTMKYKHARTASEVTPPSPPKGGEKSSPPEGGENVDSKYDYLRNARPYLNINEWTVADLNADDAWLGLNGSPTKVKKIDNVVLTHKDATVMTSSDEDINVLMKELIASHVIG